MFPEVGRTSGMRSAVPGIDWPAIPADTGAVLLALLYQLERSQWRSAGEIEASQMAQLRIMLRHAADTVPYYRERFAGVAPEALDWPAFRSLPLLSRATLQSEYEALKSGALPAGHGAILEGRTSGSVGMPVRFLQTDVCQTFWNALTLREHLWHGRDFRGRLAAVRNVSGNLSGHGWGAPADFVYQTGASGALRIDTPIPQQARWLGEMDPDYFLSYPTNIRALARLSMEQGLRLPRLREVRSMGEVVTDELRECCRRAWGVPLVDSYSCQEAGYLALQCPGATHYHAQSECVVLEILRADGTPCGAGEVGRVVLTSLHNFAMPLIRYELGDYAEAGEPCACGRGLPVIRRIAGRSRNILSYPGGETHFPLLGGERYAEIAPVRQYQVVQRSLHEVEVRLVVTRAPTADEEEALRAFILSKLGYPFRLGFSYLSSIEMGAGGKFEDFISEIA